MQKHLIAAVAALTAAAALTTGSAFASGYPGQQLAGQAKVTIQQARAIALKTVPGGRIVGEELERESGGSGLRYSFDVNVAGKTHEVGVDAQTGKILENSMEGADSD